MKYYKVNVKDGGKHRVTVRGKVDGEWVGGELVTLGEAKKYKNIEDVAKIVEINKNSIYWGFGARFEG